MSEKTILDATGLKCPLPVLKLRKALEGLSIGEKIILHADDPVAPLDVEHFCKAENAVAAVGSMFSVLVRDS